MGTGLVLRDVHVPPVPSLWPPAPGWWLVAGVVVALLVLAWWLQRRRALRLQSWQRLFDAASAQPSPPARVAAMSELLRRAARRVDPDSEKLEGQQWLEFLDGSRPGQFSDGHAALLLEGGYRRELDPASVEAMERAARTRFLELMAAGKR
jgi:hypothetical protein